MDCDGAGGAFQIGYQGYSSDSSILPVEQVVISGFHIYNAVGGTSNGGFAGGVDTINTGNISVLSSTFQNCAGREAGAIAVHASSDNGNNNVRTFLNLTVSKFSG